MRNCSVSQPRGEYNAEWLDALAAADARTPKPRPIYCVMNSKLYRRPRCFPVLWEAVPADEYTHSGFYFENPPPAPDGYVWATFARMPGKKYRMNFYVKAG